MDDSKQRKPVKFNSSQWGIVIIFVVIFIFSLLWGQLFNVAKPAKTISYTKFIDQLDNGNVKSIIIKGLRINGELVNEINIRHPLKEEAIKVKSFQVFLPSFQGESILSELKEKVVTVSVVPDEAGLFLQIVMSFLPWIILIGIWILIMRRNQQIQGGAGGLFSFGASKAKLYDAKKPHETFKEVAGMDNVKQELQETIEFLKEPERFKKLGAKVPKGVLLIGPPGTGKTLLARATAGEAEVPFYSISGSEFIEMFVGVGASRVRDMFKKAKAAQPSIIFIDEIDAVGRTRGAGLGGGHDEREQTLNQLLSEMDGFEPNEEVIVIAATNRPDVLDTALLRPGRFDRHILIDRPGWKERMSILKVHVKGKKLAETVNLKNIAKGTPGMTGADIENLTNEAALLAIRKNKDKIDDNDFEEARDKILMGCVREETITALERRITAYHEAGHAVAAYLLPNTDPIHKVSILPRGMAMGVTILLPEEDRHYYPKSYLMSKLAVTLAGRVAEMLVFEDVSSGAENDLKEGTSLAEKMVAQWGMSDKIGPLNLGRGENHPFLGRELAQPKRYSEEMAWIMDQEIQKIVVEAEANVKIVLSKNRHILDNIAEALIKEEVLGRTDVERIIEASKK